MNKEVKDSIKAIVAAEGCGFDCESEDEMSMNFATREHGSVGDETSSPVDRNAARRIVEAIKSKHPELIASWDVVDEWVNVFVHERAEP